MKPWYRLGLHDGASYAAIRTARGCPYRCTYCASERLSTGYQPRHSDRVLAEILALLELGVSDFAFYDDALLVDFENRLGPVLAGLAQRGACPRFHTPNGLHARLVTPAVARALAASRFATLRLSLETVDPLRQVRTGAKVESADLARSVEHLMAAGIPRAAVGVYLLVGLPGQGLEEVRKGVDFVRSLGVRPHLAEFSPIPGTPEWEKLTEEGTIPGDLDPLLTNNSLFFRVFGGYRRERLEALLRETRKGDPATT